MPHKPAPFYFCRYSLLLSIRNENAQNRLKKRNNRAEICKNGGKIVIWYTKAVNKIIFTACEPRFQADFANKSWYTFWYTL